MSPAEWLERCAAELQRQHANYPHEADAAFDAAGLASDVAELAAYRNLEPEAAARRYMADSQ